jgi:hypothetical protein
MGAAQRRHSGWRTPKFRRRPEKSSKRSGASWPEPMDDDESAQAKGIDRLLLSSLRYWEVERDLIEECIAAIRRWQVLRHHRRIM